jgi:hypothetical protein
MVILVSGVDPCSLQRPLVELDRDDKEMEFYPLDLLRHESGESIIIQGTNRNISRSIKKGPARGSV